MSSEKVKRGIKSWKTPFQEQLKESSFLSKRGETECCIWPSKTKKRLLRGQQSIVFHFHWKNVLISSIWTKRFPQNIRNCAKIEGIKTPLSYLQRLVEFTSDFSKAYFYQKCLGTFNPHHHPEKGDGLGDPPGCPLAVICRKSSADFGTVIDFRWKVQR